MVNLDSESRGNFCWEGNVVLRPNARKRELHKLAQQRPLMSQIAAVVVPRLSCLKLTFHKRSCASAS